MANPNGTPANLRRGGPGRKKNPLPSRNELLTWLTTMPGILTEEKNGTLLDDARHRFAEILRSSQSSTSIEWLFNQLIGSPRATVENVIADLHVFTVIGDILPEFLDKEGSERFLARLDERLKAR